MEWHEQVVEDRRRDHWAGLRKTAVLFVAFVVACFFFLQWATSATASGELRRLVGSRIATLTIEALRLDHPDGLPASSPIGLDIEVTPQEVRLAIGSLWDVVPGDLPEVMGFEVLALTPGDDVVVLVRTTDDGGGLDAPKEFACRRLSEGRTSACDPDRHDPAMAVVRWTVVAHR